MKNLFGIYTYPPAKQFGLQTKYSDFRDYIWNNNREFYEQLTKYIFEEDLWNDFENALGSFDDGEIKEMSEAAYLNYDDNYYNYDRAISDELECGVSAKWIFANISLECKHSSHILSKLRLALNESIL